jgi:hypothetical protein
MLDYVLKRDKEKKERKFMSSTLIDFHFIIAKTAEESVVFAGEEKKNTLVSCRSNKFLTFQLTLLTRLTLIVK